MIQNHTASTVSLAKTVRGALDRSKEYSSLPTRTLELLLNTLIEIAESGNPTARSIESAHGSFVASRINGAEGR